MIIEIAFDLDHNSLYNLEMFLLNGKYKFYIEPPNRFVSLEDVECQCEGK